MPVACRLARRLEALPGARFARARARARRFRRFAAARVAFAGAFAARGFRRAFAAPTCFVGRSRACACARAFASRLAEFSRPCLACARSCFAPVWRACAGATCRAPRRRAAPRSSFSETWRELLLDRRQPRLDGARRERAVEAVHAVLDALQPMRDGAQPPRQPFDVGSRRDVERTHRDLLRLSSLLAGVERPPDRARQQRVFEQVGERLAEPVLRVAAQAARAGSWRRCSRRTSCAPGLGSAGSLARGGSSVAADEEGYGAAMPDQLFLFLQFEFPWALGPPDGRYLLRATSRRRARARGRAGHARRAGRPAPRAAELPSGWLRAPRSRARERDGAPEPEPATVATTRVTVVDPVPLSAERQARAWLDELDRERDVTAAVAVAQPRAAHAPDRRRRPLRARGLPRPGARDPGRLGRGRAGRRRALAARARAAVARRRRASPARRGAATAAAALRPQERLAALLGGRGADAAVRGARAARARSTSTRAARRTPRSSSSARYAAALGELARRGPPGPGAAHRRARAAARAPVAEQAQAALAAPSTRRRRATGARRARRGAARARARAARSGAARAHGRRGLG